jgi:glutamate 5-kinase
VETDCLILLSDVDGLYTANPRRDPSAQHIPEVRTITPEIEAMAKGPVSGISRGGMESKIAAARIATAAGASVLIASGHLLHPLRAIDSPDKRTLFAARLSPGAARKRWIAGGLSARGKIVVDAGAERALLSGKSLLPPGITALEGDFERGDVVIVANASGRELARGLVAYNIEEARLLVGRRTVEIETILGYRGRDEMIHRDDLALTGSDGSDQ